MVEILTSSWSQYVTAYESLCFLIWVFKLSFNCKKHSISSTFWHRARMMLNSLTVTKKTWFTILWQLNMVVVMKTCIWISKRIKLVCCQLTVLLPCFVNWESYWIVKPTKTSLFYLTTWMLLWMTSYKMYILQIPLSTYTYSIFYKEKFFVSYFFIKLIMLIMLFCS